MKQTDAKSSIRLDKIWWGGDPLGIVQETEIWPYYQILYKQTRIYPGDWDTQISLGFSDENISLYSV